MSLAALPLGSSLAQTGQATADDIKSQRGVLLDRYRTNNVTVEDAAALTGTTANVSGGRSAKSGALSGNSSRIVPVTCMRGPKNFTAHDGTFFSTLQCSRATSMQIRVCTPDKASTDPSCPILTYPGGPITVSYSSTTVTASIAVCANPAVDGCEFRVSINGASSTSWNRNTIETDGASAAARPEARGARSNSAAANNANALSYYSSVNRPAQYSRMGAIEGGAAAGRLVNGNGTDLGALNQGGSCNKVCQDPIGDSTTTRQCIQSLDTFNSGCQTQYPRVQYNYSIGRAEETCSAIHPAACTPTAAPPAGYGPWQKYREDPIASARATGDTYTIYFASFENFSAGPPASKPVTSTNRLGPPITDESRCTRTGGSCIQFDPNFASQCRMYQSRSYCPYDRATTCQEAAFIAGRPTPPAGTAGATQFNHPGPQAYTLPDGKNCSYGDTSIDPEAIEDGAPTCALTQDGVCVTVAGQVECESTQQTTPPPCTGPKYAGCTAEPGTCTKRSPAGTCIEWTTNYTCPTTNPQCQRYKTVCSANGVVYSEEEDSSSSGWANAITTLAAVDQMTSEAKDACAKDGTCDMTNIKVFTGKPEGCVKQLGSSFAGALCDFSPPDYTVAVGVVSPCLFGAIRTNCCDEDLNEEQNSLIGGNCSSGDVSLAAARRQERAYRVGERCTNRIDFGFTSVCTERTQFWCWWPSVLAKEVNVQGREQLKAIYATTSTTVESSSTMNWNVFAGNDTGNWTPVTMAGTAQLMAWQWPQYCNAPKDTRQSNSNCGSTRETYLMVCQAKDCATVVPTHPTKSTVDAPNWYAIDVPRFGEGSASYPIGKYGFAQGSCNGTSCSFTVSAQRDARSRNSVGLMELEWPWTDPETGVGERAMNSKYGIIAYPNAPGTPRASTARIGLSTAPNLSNPDATAYTYYNLPTDGSSRTITVGGKTIKVTGECDWNTNLCNHRFYVPLAVVQKRWNINGTTDTVRRTSELDCSGFTVEEFALIDVGKMNLDPVINSMTNGNKGAPLTAAQTTIGNYSSTAQSTFVKKETEYTTGKTQSRNTAGYASQVITLTPAAGRPPWTTSLSYPVLYPAASVGDYGADPYTQKGTRVNRVVIDWGDGSSTTSSPSTSSGRQSVPHTYAAGPNLYEKDYEITATFYLDASTDGAAVPTPIPAFGATQSCGPGCMRVILGAAGNDFYRGGNCEFRTESTSITVARPELIQSATLVQVSYDDWMRNKVNGNIVWNAHPNWPDSIPVICGENRNRGVRYPNVDVTSYFRNATPGSSVVLRHDISFSDGGDGYSIWELRTTEPCRFETDGCAGGVVGGTGLQRVVKARAASRYDEADLSRRSGGAEDSVTEHDVRPPTGAPVPGAK